MSQIPPQVPPPQQPYGAPQPPPPPGTGGPMPLGYAPPAPRNDIREIAKRQRAIQICILVYICAVVGQFIVPPELRIIPALIALVVIITATVFVFMLAIALYNTGVGIVLGILTLIPIVGLFVLLIVNGKATNVLRQHGVQVGLLGANMDQIPEAGPPQR
jgi:hypothetical protein